MPWSKHEAVILLDGYLESKNNKIPRLKIVKEISNKLRQMAINQGIEIDTIYRNENGISFQMTSMASAYEMTNKGKPATKLFSEIADMYRNNNEMYKNILLEANEMILGSNSSHKPNENYKIWLIENKGLSRSTATDYYSILNVCDNFAHDNNIYSEHLTDTEDLHTIERLINLLFTHEEFSKFNTEKYGRCSRALNYYIEYCGGNAFNSGSISTHKADDKFRTWLLEEKNLSNSTSSYYCTLLGACDDFAHNNQIYNSNLTDTENLQSVEQLTKLLFGHPEFEAFNSEKHGRCSRALNYYVEYCGGASYNTSSASTHKANDKYKEWLIKIQGLSIKTSTDYCNVLGTCDDFAHFSGIYTENITDTEDIEVVYKLSRLLLNNNAFLAFNDEKNGRCTRALNYYVDYCSSLNGNTQLYLPDSDNSFEAKADGTVDSTSSISNEMRDECNLILLENFEDGYRIGNYMHQMRFINLYNSNFNSQLDKQPSEIDDLLKSIGRLVDDRIFASDGNDANDIIKEVTECIKSTFDSGASNIFYECLYERFRDKLVSEMNIYSSDTLKSVLQSNTDLRMYSFNKTHIARFGSSNDIESEITSILIESHVPISYDDIQKKLWYIPLDSIRNAIGRIERAAYVGDSSFIYAPNFNISSDELSKLITAMHNAIYSKGYIVAKDLQELYIKNCPFSAMDSSDYKDYAIREILSVLLKDKFNFSSSVISEIGTNLTYGDIYENYAKERDMVTVNELRELSDNLGTPIYWDNIMNQMIRISSSELVNKRLFNFDIEAVDKHLETICDRDYVLLKDIRLYLSFPPLNYKWNGFILYSYLLLFSRKFSIVRHGFVYSDYFGAMVKNTSPLQSYEQIAADLLSKDNSWNDEKSALKCIINAGLQKNSANKHIASIIKMAKQIRNNKQ